MKQINFPCARYFHFIKCYLKKTIHIIFMMIILMDVNSFAKIITVDDDGPADFTTIQSAIDSANNGDTVFVKAGIYKELITVNKNILLVGEGREKTIITSRASDIGHVVVNFSKEGIIRGFTITGGQNNSGISGIPAIIENNIVTNNTTGIFIGWGIIKNNIIKNNTVGILFIIDPYKDNRLVIESNEIYENNKGIKYSIGFPDYPDSTQIFSNSIYNNLYGIYFEHETPLPKTFKKVNSIENYLINAKWNWWGTAKEDSIANSIFDHNDAEDNTAVVDFSEWLNEQQNLNNHTDTIGIHYNNIFSNTNFNLYASIPNVVSLENGELNKSEESFYLYQNYPNPFNPSTTITYQLPKNGNVTLKIFDILGNEVKTLVNEQKEMGKYTVQFDASSLASGMYIYRLRANDYTSTKKMLLLK